MNKLAIILIINCISQSNSLFCQNDSLEGSFYKQFRENLEVRIPVNCILGNWISKDSIHGKISFVRDCFLIKIYPQNFINPYSFQIKNDSIKASGTAANWPPYYCILCLKPEQTLQIKYYSLGSNGITYRYYIKEED